MSGVENKDANKNIINVKNLVRKSENPNPLIIVIIILVTMIIIYFIFINVIKLSITGIWLDEYNKSYDIVHNKWKDTILVNGEFRGIIKGHLIVIYINNKADIGIWINNKINWLDGSIWQCNYGY